ncbi:MAG: FdhF/YdeP family oxidoreductase [Hyphomicrobiaceae bacterium]|nr:FdhF/YdeP family oxidoreductase [Hyphomicrobiaceae bacterium]
MAADPNIEEYQGPVGGWGSARSLTKILLREHIPLKGASVLLHQNKPGGFACVSCSYAKPTHPRTFEFCENGAKGTAWEITRKRCTLEFFAEHTLTELESWSDYDLEEQGRLLDPMRWDAGSDRYVPVTWAEAFAGIGEHLRGFAPKSVVFYASGRASLEASYMYQLFARMYGNNNLPDSSNMCHESTSVALPETIGVPVGTVKLEELAHTDCMLFLGQNVGVNSPRMLHELQEARRRGVPILTFNPLRERGLERFTNPQSPVEMATLSETQISTQYHQLNPGGDLAALVGMAKVLLDLDRASAGANSVLDRDFIAEHCAGFAEFVVAMDAFTWDDIEACSGLSRGDITAAAEVYASCNAVVAFYGMGLTQHRSGVLAIQMLSNLLLLRGNIGKLGAGIFPVRGHSNVQGQRTVGITEKPELAPLDEMEKQFGFAAPREVGLNTVEACEGVLAGEISAFISLGGNFVRAIPETDAMETAWRELPLTVQIITKLNRGAVIHGKAAYLLPCLGRIEVDAQATGDQFVTIEDTTGRFHASRGQVEPAGANLLSEPRIVAELAKSTLPPNDKVQWDRWCDDYGLIREAIAQSFPKVFEDFNERIKGPAGFDRPLPARQRIWKTKTGKANFVSPSSLSEDPDLPCCREGILTLITVRSNDQFNTTVYGYEDRLRGIHGTRKVVLMNKADMAERSIADGDAVDIIGDAGDAVERHVLGMRATLYDVPKGSCVGYFPECNPLLPLWHHAKGSKVPAAKSIPVRVVSAV